MNRLQNNCFQDFFEEEKYVALKNHLYNYLLRKRAVEKIFKRETPELVLEVGSGTSPVMTCTTNIVYSDLSFLALQILKRTYGKGWFVVADAMSLPFKSDAFTHTICSEVLEHLANDRKALKELVRVMKLSAFLIVTFPHREFYFARDDRFVKHLRRYELSEMENRLMEAGLETVSFQKVLGPFEKVTMCFVVFCFSLIQKFKPQKTKEIRHFRILISIFKWVNRFYAGIARLDARIMPRSLSTVLLIKARKLY